MCHSRRSALWLHHVLRVRPAPNWPHPLLKATPLGGGGGRGMQITDIQSHTWGRGYANKQGGALIDHTHHALQPIGRQQHLLTANGVAAHSHVTNSKRGILPHAGRDPLCAPRMVIGKQGMGIPYVGLGTPKMGIGTPKYPYMGTRRLQYGVTTSDIGTGTPRMSLYGGRKTPIWGQDSLTWAQGPPECSYTGTYGQKDPNMGPGLPYLGTRTPDMGPGTPKVSLYGRIGTGRPQFGDRTPDMGARNPRNVPVWG